MYSEWGCERGMEEGKKWKQGKREVEEEHKRGDEDLDRQAITACFCVLWWGVPEGELLGHLRGRGRERK